jgi:cation transporter-like permease
MARNPDTSRNLVIGCLMLPMGAASGGMTGVLLSKLVAMATRAPSCQDIPTCDWYVYAGWGALLGAITLPALVSWRLWTGASRRESDPTIDTNRS